MPSSDERDLALRVQRGDSGAFGEIVCLHQQAVFNVAHRILGNARDAEDAAQETFIRAYQFFEKFDADRPLGPWLKRIAANVCMNRLEGQKPVAELDDEATLPSDASPGPEAQVIGRDRDERVRAELSRLPTRYRIVIELRHFQDLTYEEIAAQLERSLSDVKSDLFRARRLLAERLKDLK